MTPRGGDPGRGVAVWIVEYRHLDSVDLNWSAFSVHLRRQAAWKDMKFWRERGGGRREVFRTRRAVAR